MSIIDFITGLFRDPANLRAFLDDPDHALAEAGLPDATPEDVQSLLPTVAESMPSDHPLQLIAQSKDPHEALRHLEVEELCAPPLGDKVIGATGADKAIGAADDAYQIVDAAKAGKWESAVDSDKGIGSLADDPLTPDVEEDIVDPAQEIDEPYSDHALDADLADTEFSSAVWGKEIE